MPSQYHNFACKTGSDNPIILSIGNWIKRNCQFPYFGNLTVSKDSDTAGLNTKFLLVQIITLNRIWAPHSNKKLAPLFVYVVYFESFFVACQDGRRFSVEYVLRQATDRAKIRQMSS